MNAPTAEPKKRGRPPIAADLRQTERVEVRLTPEHRAKLDRLGGAQWLRERIEKARE